MDLAPSEMPISKEECLVVQERALVVNLCDGQGHQVRVEVTAGVLSTGPGVAHLTNLEPSAFSLRSGDLVHTPTSAGAWGLGFRVLANDSHYQDLCSLFVTGYTQEQRPPTGAGRTPPPLCCPLASPRLFGRRPGRACSGPSPPAATPAT